MSHKPGSDQPVSHKLRSLKKIISGGQTGVDRAALDFAIEHDIPYGGWCPKGRKAEDGPIGSRYLLKETPTSTYPQRTEWNVRDSDGTVIFSLAPCVDRRLKEDRRFRDQIQEAVASRLS